MKKAYIKPEVETVKLKPETLMITASPGVDNGTQGGDGNTTTDPNAGTWGGSDWG